MDMLGSYPLNTIITGDVLDILPELPTASVDLVIADPPYSINTKSDGQGKINPWGDRMNAAFWFKSWINQCFRILKPTGALWSFTNWRSFATMQKVSDDLCWPIESVLVWHKDWIGPGGQRGLRPCYELVSLWAKDSFSISNRSLYDVQIFPWSSHKPNGHPAEKPVNLIRWLIEISGESPLVVLDPFIGSGTSAEACGQTNNQYLGIEIDERIAQLARQRVTNVQPPLFVSGIPQGVLAI